MNTFERIYEIVKQIPGGKVATYGQIASLAGNPLLQELWVMLCMSIPEPDEIPCFRVVNRNGCTSKAFAFGGEDHQRMMLELDGVIFTDDGRVDLDKCLWDGNVNTVKIEKIKRYYRGVK